MEFFEYIQKEWAILSSAPGTFVLETILAFIAAFGVARWHYEGMRRNDSSLIDSLRERLEAHKDELRRAQEQSARKDELLAQYRQRFSVAATHTTTALASLANHELRDRTIRLVSELRKFREDIDQVTSRQRPHWDVPGWDEMSEEQKNAVFEASNKVVMEAYKRLASEYASRFKVEAASLRDELVRRLPSVKRESGLEMFYKHPNNAFSLDAVADDLELLAISLPVDDGLRETD